jgi:hypothetical protein
MLDHTQEKYYIVHTKHILIYKKKLQNYQNQLIFKLIVWAHKCIVDFMHIVDFSMKPEKKKQKI